MNIHFGHVWYCKCGATLSATNLARITTIVLSQSRICTCLNNLVRVVLIPHCLIVVILLFYCLGLSFPVAGLPLYHVVARTAVPLTCLSVCLLSHFNKALGDPLPVSHFSRHHANICVIFTSQRTLHHNCNIDNLSNSTTHTTPSNA